MEKSNCTILKIHYLSLGKDDLNNLKLIFLEKFDYLLSFYKNKEKYYKLFENINIYFDFINKNLKVHTKSEYKQLKAIIKVASIIMETGARLKSFHHFYEGYISLRDNITKCGLSKEIYKEKILF